MRTVVAFFFLLLTPVNAPAQSFEQFISQLYALPESRRTAAVDTFMAHAASIPFMDNDTTAVFIYRGNASSVTIPGDANNWNAASFPMWSVPGTNFWYYLKHFESDARLDYKFVLNGGTWILDPLNPRTVTGGLGPNSELRMPRYPDAPEIVFDSTIAHGSTHDTVFYSTNLGNSRTVRIYLPAGYGSSTDSMPMILFHDGLDYSTLGSAVTVLDNLIAAHLIEPTIAVFVPSVNRTDEYSGSQLTGFMNFITQELLPVIDATYRTRRAPSSRAVLGASLGGNISLCLGYFYPGVFGNVAAQSPYIDSSLGVAYQKSPVLTLKLYVDIGTYDIPQLIAPCRSFAAGAELTGYPIIFREYHEGHSWGNWRAHIDNALEMFFPPAPAGVASGTTYASSARLDQNFPNPFNPATIIRYQLPAEADVTLRVYNMLGQMVAELASGRESAGWNSIGWRPGNVSSGVYYYRLQVSNIAGTKQTFSLERKMLLLR